MVPIQRPGPVLAGVEAARRAGWLAPGARVLVVEDDLMMSEDLRGRLERRGCTVLGPVEKVSDALTLLMSGPAPSFAILDTHLEDETTEYLAEVLRRAAIPFVFATDMEPWGLVASFGEEPSFAKPVSLILIERRAQA
jgi:CheY-like chemotaxis protein